MFSDFWFWQSILDGVERHQGPVYLYYYNYNTTYTIFSQFFDPDLYFGKLVSKLDRIRELEESI